MSILRNFFLSFLALTSLIVVTSAESSSTGETYTFQTEVSRLLDLIINSLYTNKEIFVRELLANGSDALDKLRMRSLEDPKVLDASSDMRIRVHVDNDKKTLTFEDSGIGMTKKELGDLLGTIAKSGTAEWVKKLQQKSADSSSLIGQFGVGFYASFLVADKVTVVSKSPDDGEQWAWESVVGSTQYTLRPGDVKDLARGTQVILHMKKDAEEFMDQEKLEDLIKKYAQFYPYPIYLLKQVEEPIPKEEKKEEDRKDKDEKEKVEEEDKEEKTLKVQRDVLMNPSKPIWMREAKGVSEEEYNGFFKATFKEYSDPLLHVHFKAEGDAPFRGLFYIPKRRPFMPFQTSENPDEELKTVGLYVRRVFTKREQLFSEPLSHFIYGIVDSDDLPLNVSREVLQNSSLITQVRTKSVNTVLNKLADLMESDKKAYDEFYSAFSHYVKLEIVRSDQFRLRLARLLRFSTTKSDTPKTLQQYVDDMPESQKFIYFLAGNDLEELKRSPLLEALIAKDIEVILATETVDEYCLQMLAKFGKFEFKNVAKEKAVDADGIGKEKVESFSPLLDWLKKDVLKSEVSDVVLTGRLTNSSCAVAASEHGLTGTMEAMMRAQAGSGSDPMLKFMRQRVFELNPNHPTISVLLDMASSGDEKKKTEGARIARTLFDAALIRSGFQLGSSKAFAENIDYLISAALDGTAESSEPSRPSSGSKVDKAKQDIKSAGSAQGSNDAEPKENGPSGGHDDEL